jgi:hypothetical protein
MHLTFGAISILIEVGGVWIGITAWGYKLFRKIDRVTEKADQIEDVVSGLRAIKEQSELWRQESKQWHENHLEYLHNRRRG